ncbi:hypothetical protein VQ042_22425 [Aurantimonas sp. A2-1-M11]|uniref:hypothetical protein n=1 Tax=Aurantimonas sp. A2-1-M11 TaxID=3113712 RepID=UPI002F927AAF
MTKIFFSNFPKPLIFMFSDDGFILYVCAKRFQKKFGRMRVYAKPVERIAQLEFTNGLQPEPFVTTDTNGIRISGRALMQMVIFHATTREDRTFRSDDLRIFFHGNHLNAAERFMEYVAEPLLRRVPSKALLYGASQRDSVAWERAAREQFWHKVGARMEGVHG